MNAPWKVRNTGQSLRVRAIDCNVVTLRYALISPCFADEYKLSKNKGPPNKFTNSVKSWFELVSKIGKKDSCRASVTAFWSNLGSFEKNPKKLWRLTPNLESTCGAKYAAVFRTHSPKCIAIWDHPWSSPIFQLEHSLYSTSILKVFWFQWQKKIYVFGIHVWTWYWAKPLKDSWMIWNEISLPCPNIKKYCFLI